MNDFVEKYQKSGAAVNYGFPVEPLKYEGAGCTSFANAAVQKTGLKLPLSEAWLRHIKLPLKLMGRLEQAYPGTIPLELAKSSEDTHIVPITDFIFKDLKWAQGEEAYKDFYYYDPELFYESFVHIENVYRQNAGMSLKKPVRTNGYDSTQLQTRQISEEWITRVLNDPRNHVRLGKISSTTGLIVDQFD